MTETLDKYGGWLGFTRDNLRKGEEFFDRHDRNAVLIGRLVPGLRSFIAVPAGLRGMPFWKFFWMNLVGTAFWVSVLTALGAVLGQNYHLVDQYSSYITYAMLGALVLFVVYRIAKVGLRQDNERARTRTFQRLRARRRDLQKAWSEGP